jgi:hypothetical protein
VVGARVTASGAVDAAPLSIATGSANQVLAAVGGDGRDYLVVYALFSQSPPHSVLAAKRVLRDGSLDAVTATEAGTIVFDGADEIQGARYAMVIARDHTGFWLAWPTQRYPDARIVLLHTDASGHPDDPITLLQYDGSQLNVRVALAQTATGSLQIVYARSDDEGSFAGTSRLFLRFAGDSGNRWRAARH